MTFKGMAVAAAALTSFTAAVVPASATTIADAHASTLAASSGDRSVVDALSTNAVDAAATEDRQARPASFTAIAGERHGIIAPLTFIVESADGAVAVKGDATTVTFANGRETVVRQRTAGAFNADVGGLSILPEATTWAMMLVGFGMIGLGLRYGIRRSNAKFDRKVQRIAAGLEA